MGHKGLGPAVQPQAAALIFSLLYGELFQCTHAMPSVGPNPGAAESNRGEEPPRSYLIQHRWG